MDCDLYENDFYRWTTRNARLLRERKLEEADIDNIAEELETMGRSEKRQLINRLSVLFAHLLKWEFQPSMRSKSWQYTIKEQRNGILDLLEDSPSLRHKIESVLEKAYQKAIILAVKDTGLDETAFPETCPYSFDKAVNEEVRI